jgi:hypothetical protein
MNGEEPSAVLDGEMNNRKNPHKRRTHRPAAKMLDELPLLTSTAVTGPGIAI